MKTRVAVLISGVATLFTLAACDSGPVTGADASHFTASIQGVVETTYQGHGHFRVSTPPEGLPRPTTFVLFSSNGTRASQEAQSFMLQRIGTGLPAVGRYTLGKQGFGSVDPQVFSATYERKTGDRIESYRARSGVVEITSSSADRIEGTFRFAGSRTCEGTRSHMVCSVISGDEAGTAMIEVSGSFTAAPARDGRVATPLR